MSTAFAFKRELVLVLKKFLKKQHDPQPAITWMEWPAGSGQG